MTISRKWVIDRPPTRDDADKDSRVELAKYQEGDSCVQVNWKQVGAGVRWRPTKHWQDPAVAIQLPIATNVTCSACRYWQKRATPGTDDADWCGEWEARSRYWQKWAKPGGECRRNAPQSVMIHAEIDAYWPGTDDADWCGEWEARK
jgi:hypothetical protein